MHKIHFIAIGGAAMHNLALAMAEKEGYIITGSDDEIFEPSRSRLEKKGLLPKEFGWFPEKITSDLTSVIVGMHATEDNPELVQAKKLGLKIYSFPEYLYEQTRYKTRIVVGGSHGKTTTTAMILYVLKNLNIPVDYMVGAQIEGFENMVKLSRSARIAVFEGDEYLTSPIDLRPKFHLYKPHIAILTGIAWDHINVFPTFEKYVEQFSIFSNLIEHDGRFIYFDEDPELCKIAEKVRHDIISLPYHTPAAEVKDGITYLKLKDKEIPLNIFGQHNLQNLNAARLACHQIGISDADFYRVIVNFHGASNRLEKICEFPDRIAFKDFAHSPSKLKATVLAVKTQFTDKKLVACMELHTFSSLTAEFLPQYKNCMAKADVAYVYFNPAVCEHKRLTPITEEEVQTAFGSENVRVFTDTNLLQAELRKLEYDNTALLLMTSGNFSGVNLKEFAKELLTK